ncbi:MAG: hypothetical protein CMO80_24355, partial [Verrucomicrobiales bacterium]|nr:hypothetical protein [Verrucomicrobiales bacterium]
MYLLCLIVIILGVAPVFSETVVSGRIVEAESDLPLDGVRLSAGSQATTTDPHGRFLLSVPELPIRVQVTRLGYTDTTLVIRDTAPSIKLRTQPIPLLEVRITDTTSVSTAIARLPSFTTVVERASFEGQTHSLPSILDRSTGIQIQSMGGSGSFSTISVRGSSSEQVEVYLDDILLNAAVGGGVNLGNLPLANVSRIEVSRGAGAVGNGLGGTVTLRTRDLKEENRTDISSSWGSFDTRGLTVFSSGASGKARYLTVLDYASSDNNFGFLDNNGTEYNLTDDVAEDRENNDVASGSLLAKASVALGSQRHLSLSQTVFVKQQGIPGISNNQSRSARLNTTHLTTELSFEDRALAARTSTRQSIYFSRLRETFLDTAGEVGVGRQNNAYVTKTLGHRSRTKTTPSDRVLFTLNSDIRRETYDPTAHIQLITPLFASRRWTLGS